jgi:hypothetical protein
LKIIDFIRRFFFEPNRYIKNIHFIDLVPTVYESFSIQLTTIHHKTRTPPISRLPHIIEVRHAERVSISIILNSKCDVLIDKNWNKTAKPRVLILITRIPSLTLATKILLLWNFKVINLLK